MRVKSIRANNYRPFKKLDETKLNSLSVLIGKNDSGKSSILRALQSFLSDKPLQKSDLHYGANVDEDIIIEVSFISLPKKIQFESRVNTTFEEENLVDRYCNLRIRKTYNSRDNFKPKVELIVQDFDGSNYFGLVNKKEEELNGICDSLSIDLSKFGRNVTNKIKRKKIREKALEGKIPLKECPLELEKKVWSIVNKSLPTLDLFETDTKLGVNETTFQNKFNHIISKVTKSTDRWARDYFKKQIETSLQKEVNSIFEYFKRHDPDFKSFSVESTFSWDKAVKFDIIGEDRFAVKKSIDERGSGIRRLLMVSFFQYMAETKHADGSLIFGIEEPENSLHPGLQRELYESFAKIAKAGHQIIITSHSPVFAGSADLESLTLIVRNLGIAKAKQSSNFNALEIAEELGVQPSDQITSFKACIFVEGMNDTEFFNTIASKMKSAGIISEDFKDKDIGFIIHGGDNLKHFVEANALSKLSKKFGVIIDSDKEYFDHKIPQRKLNWKSKCESKGGKFFILRKREIENYIYPAVIKRELHKDDEYDDFSDMKKIFGPNVYKLIEKMNIDEIKNMGYYEDDTGSPHSELTEIIIDLLDLV